MNENEMRKDPADPCDPTQCDPLQTESAEAVVEDEPLFDTSSDTTLAPPEGEDEGSAQADSTDDPSDPPTDLEIPSNPDPNSDPDHSAAIEATPEEQLRQLRDELTRLRQAIAQQDAILSRMGEECREFHTLYPETSLSDLSDDVWKDVKQGIPLAAAYALAERRRTFTESLAATANQKNGQRSSGALESTESDYFSPNEVRAMTQKEVRANYQKIMRSMQKWH